MLHGLHFAWKMIKKRPIRMGLTLLQVAIGVAAVIIVFSFIFSMFGWTDGEAKTEIIKVTYGKRGIDALYSTIFTHSLVESIKAEKHYFDEVSMVHQSNRVHIEYGGMHYQTDGVYAVSPEFATITNLQLKEGNFFTGGDLKNRTPVALISEKMHRQLFGNKSGIGEKITFTRLRRTPETVEIIGVYVMNENLNSGPYQSVHMVYPYTLNVVTGDEKSNYFTDIWVLCKADKIANAEEEIDRAITRYLEAEDSYFLYNGSYPIFTLHNQETTEERREIASTFGLFIGSFAFVSVIITALGIFSMLLVSIVERTHEIGLRRALGASRASVLGQIVSESVMISVVGSIVGVVIAVIGFKPLLDILFLNQVFTSNWAMVSHLTVFPILAGVGITVLLGVIVSLYPGIQAAKYLPVEAIRNHA